MWFAWHKFGGVTIGLELGSLSYLTGSLSFNPIFNQTLTIHFICTGNIYRSRLAEAYCASSGGPGLHVYSSGIGTSLNRDVSISPYAARVLEERGLERFASPSWQQTTAALVRASDVLVFMERKHYCFCQDWIDPKRQTVEIWDIQDVGQADASGIVNQVKRTFEMIRQRTDVLLAALGVKG